MVSQPRDFLWRLNELPTISPIPTREGSFLSPWYYITLQSLGGTWLLWMTPMTYDAWSSHLLKTTKMKSKTFWSRIDVTFYNNETIKIYINKFEISLEKFLEHKNVILMINWVQNDQFWRKNLLKTTQMKSMIFRSVIKIHSYKKILKEFRQLSKS